MDVFDLFVKLDPTYNFSSIPDSHKDNCLLWNKSWDLGGDSTHYDFFRWVEFRFKYMHPVIYSEIIQSLNNYGMPYDYPILFALKKFAEEGKPEIYEDDSNDDEGDEVDDEEYSSFINLTF